MEYTEIKEWLDWHIDSIIERNQRRHFNNLISILVEDEWIFCPKGIDIVADLLDIPLKEEYREDMECHYKYSFEYRGFKIVQVQEERLESFVRV